METKIKVLIADNHSLITSGLKMLIECDDGIEVVGEVHDYDAVFSAFLKTKANVLLLDIFFGENKYGFELAQEILLHNPEAKIIFISQYDSVAFINKSYQLGKCFLNKNASTDEVLGAIKTVMLGKTYVSPKVAEIIVTQSAHASTFPHLSLSPEELAVFIEIAKGETFQTIAEKMGCTTRTIANRVSAIKSKMNMQKFANMTIYALKHNLIQANIEE